MLLRIALEPGFSPVFGCFDTLRSTDCVGVKVVVSPNLNPNPEPNYTNDVALQSILPRCQSDRELVQTRAIWPSAVPNVNLHFHLLYLLEKGRPLWIKHVSRKLAGFKSTILWNLLPSPSRCEWKSASRSVPHTYGYYHLRWCPFRLSREQ